MALFLSSALPMLLTIIDPFNRDTLAGRGRTYRYVSVQHKVNISDTVKLHIVLAGSVCL